MNRTIIDVNERGVDADGESYDDYATDDALSEGLLLNQPVLIRYPDGRTEEGNQVRFTPKGIALLSDGFSGGPKSH